MQGGTHTPEHPLEEFVSALCPIILPPRAVKKSEKPHQQVKSKSSPTSWLEQAAWSFYFGILYRRNSSNDMQTPHRKAQELAHRSTEQCIAPRTLLWGGSARYYATNTESCPNMETETMFSLFFLSLQGACEALLQPFHTEEAYSIDMVITISMEASHC